MVLVTFICNILALLVVPVMVFLSPKGAAVRFSTLEAICKALERQQGDILAFVPEEDGETR